MYIQRVTGCFSKLLVNARLRSSVGICTEKLSVKATLGDKNVGPYREFACFQKLFSITVVTFVPKRLRIGLLFRGSFVERLSCTHICRCTGTLYLPSMSSSDTEHTEKSTINKYRKINWHDGNTITSG